MIATASCVRQAAARGRALGSIWPSIAALAVLSGAACGDMDEARIVADVPLWSVDSVPIFGITGLAPDGALAFEYATGATRLADGTIAVGDDWAAAVRFFDESGVLVRSSGRHGEGPGEFGRIGWLGQCRPDTLFVWDANLRRMTLLESDGDFVRVFRIPRDAGEMPPPVLMSCSRSGVIATLALGRNQDPRFDSQTGESPLLQGLATVNPSGEVTLVIGEVVLGRSAPLRGIAALAVSSDRVYHGGNDSALVDAYALDGRHITTISVDVMRRPPSQEHYRELNEARSRQLTNPDDRHIVIELAMRIPMPEFLPPYAALFTDPSDDLWVQLSHPSDSLTHLRAIAADGRVLGDVLIPKDMRVFEVGQNYVLGAFDDDSGEPHVAMFEYRREK